MPWNGGLSSLWNHAKLYKLATGNWFDWHGICFVCRGLASRKELLCNGCFSDLPWRPYPRLRRRIESVDAAFAAFRYEFPVTDLVKSVKFHADLGALSVLTAGFTEDLLTALEDVDVVVPVPLLPWRFLRRGFNQAGELARVLGRTTHRPVRHDLVSRQHTWGPAQSLLDAAARRDNMKGAFRVAGNFTDLRVAIVDDVITTGATCSALAKALRAAGATRIIAVAAAATALRRDEVGN